MSWPRRGGRLSRRGAASWSTGEAIVGIIGERLEAAATERLSLVAASVQDGGEGDAVERAARRLASVNPKARIENVLVEVDAGDLANVCASVESGGDDASIVALAKTLGDGARSVAGRSVAVRADQLLKLSRLASV